MRAALRLLTVCAMAWCASGALAQSAVTTSAVNVRAGPERFFPTVTWLLGGTPVQVMGCVEGWRWCDVVAGRDRGWVYARYLSTSLDGRKVTIREGGPTLGLTPAEFSLLGYWQAHYANRIWFAQAGRYQTRWEQHRSR